MCGIVAFYGKQENTLPTLLDGLKRLEYRGYDSAGVALPTTDKKYFSVKKTGKVINLEKALDGTSKPNFSGVGIAHTRWATHGIPTDNNAHPHAGYQNKIWLVHNGIIENYRELKEKLIKAGATFKSDTDTEVLANLIESEYKGDLKEAVLKALGQVEGAYAIAVFAVDEPDRVIGAKNGSPLVLGLAEEEYLLASDVTPIISKTRNVIYLEDGEMVDIQDKKYKITNLENEEIYKETHSIEWDAEQASKEGFEHYLMKEISEQPRAVKDSTRGRLVEEEATIKFGGLIDVMDRIQKIEKVVILGVGSAFFAASLGELFFEALAHIPAKAEMSPEFRYKETSVDDKTWVIAISQSGETKDTIEAITEAKRKGALVTGIVNMVGSTIARITDAGVYNHAGPEISVASTKATTSQYVILLMHAILLGRMKGLGYGEALEIIKDIKNLPGHIEKVVSKSDEIKTLVEKYIKKDIQHFAYLGRKYNYPIAREGAIKLKEISYIHAEAFSSGELKHGPLAMINPDFPTFAICTKDVLYDKQVSTIQEVVTRQGPVIAVATEGDEGIKDFTKDIIYVPATETEEVQAIVNNIAQQIFAYHYSSGLDIDVDQPRNLAKSVTVE